MDYRDVPIARTPTQSLSFHYESCSSRREEAHAYCAGNQNQKSPGLQSALTIATRFGVKTAGLLLAILFALVPGALAQRTPDIGYVFPAGGRQGATVQVKLAGQYLDGVSGADISGTGVQATVVDYVKPLNGKQINLLRDRLKALQQGLRSARRTETKIDVRSEINTNVVEHLDRAAVQQEITDIRDKLANPKNRKRDNPQLSEDVTLRVTVAADAELGKRELRLKTALGLSNPLAFYVGQLSEFAEQEPNDKTADAGMLSGLPLVINGQIMPGDVDRFRLKLSKGLRLVVVASARELRPYLADAVPGWFQATLALYDAKGDELAYDDDYRFHPDPVLFYQIPQDGEYVMEIKDAIYRGREDFVYRITVGELPFVTSIFPLGGQPGTPTTVALKGWNLPVTELTLDAEPNEAGILPVSVRKDGLVSNHLPFAVDPLPEALEQEPNNQEGGAQPIPVPAVVNGRIDSPGDTDVFRFAGRAGDELVAEVYARRLDSPLDSVLKLTDANGQQLAFNDDHEDKGSGLNTHHADSYFMVRLPVNGTYYLHLSDAQHHGGAAYGYRLRVSPPHPDFELRVVPPSLNARAGGAVPVTIYALRRDGFSNDIRVFLQDAPTGFTLAAGRVAADKDQVKLSLRVPTVPSKQAVALNFEGRAWLQGRQIVHAAVPAEDMMQAFAYRHLVPVQAMKVSVINRGRAGAGMRNLAQRGKKKAAPKKSKTN